MCYVWKVILTITCLRKYVLYLKQSACAIRAKYRVRCFNIPCYFVAIGSIDDLVFQLENVAFGDYDWVVMNITVCFCWRMHLWPSSFIANHIFNKLPAEKLSNAYRIEWKTVLFCKIQVSCLPTSININNCYYL